MRLNLVISTLNPVCRGWVVSRKPQSRSLSRNIRVFHFQVISLDPQKTRDEHRRLSCSVCYRRKSTSFSPLCVTPSCSGACPSSSQLDAQESEQESQAPKHGSPLTITPTRTFCTPTRLQTQSPRCSCRRAPLNLRARPGNPGRRRHPWGR